MESNWKDKLLQKIGDYVSIDHTIAGDRGTVTFTSAYETMNPCVEIPLAPNIWMRDPGRTVMWDTPSYTQIPMFVRSFVRKFKVKNPNLGWGCGYVIIDSSHPFYHWNTEAINNQLPSSAISLSCYGDEALISKWSEIDETYKNVNFRILGFHVANFEGDGMDEEFVTNGVFELRNKMERL